MKDYEKCLFSYYRGGIRVLESTRSINIYDLYKYLVSDYAYSKTCAIRLQSEKRKRAVLKRGLDYITPAGVFVKRSTSSLISVSGLMVLDFDDVPDSDSFVSRLPFIPLLSFVSPSGCGVKCIIDGRDWLGEQGFTSFNVPLEYSDDNYLVDIAKKYKLAFQQMAKYVDVVMPLDWSGADITRACYLCCDPLTKLYNDIHCFDKLG